MYKKILLHIIIGFLTISCVGIKPQSTRSGKKAYETFYVGSAGTQYFIKPMEFKGENNDFLEMDITFRHKKSYDDSATVNISFFLYEPLKDISNVKISSGNRSVEMVGIERLFVEKRGDQIVTRFSTRAYMPEMKNLFEDSNWSVSLNAEDYRNTFIPSRKTAKKIALFQENIFTIL